MTNKTELLQIRVTENTLQQIDKIQAIVKAPSRSDAIRRSFDLSEALLNEIIKGGRVILEDKKGRQREILVTGINL